MYDFTVPDEEVALWLVMQLRRLAGNIGLELVDETGYNHSFYARCNMHARTDADIEYDALVTESEERHEEEQDKTRKIRKTRKTRSVAHVLQAFHEMGCTEQELQIERTRLFFDNAYRLFWTQGDWLDSA